MDTIAENCASKPQRSQECLIAVLEKWLMLEGSKATWNKLEHAITNVQRAGLGLPPLEMSMLNVIFGYSIVSYGHDSSSSEEV